MRAGGVSAHAGVAAKKSTGGAASSGVDSEHVKQLEAEIQEARLNMDTLEKERDFYFGKLRDIEMFI